MSHREVYYSGEPYPLGATWDGKGVNFALYAENAEEVELCLFNTLEDATESRKINLLERTHHVWHTYVMGIGPGQLYGYRVHGPFNPSEGHRFNKNKLLLDPYAKGISGNIKWDDALFGYEIGDPGEDLSFNTKDSAEYMPKSVVIDASFDWGNDRSPKIPYHKTIIYEAHVKGLTILHPDLPENLRGTYEGIAHPVIIQHLKSLGITAIELMPIHYFVEDRHLLDRGLTNYWGYNTIGFFAPDARFSSTKEIGQEVVEFKNMVKKLHQEGIEVILDVVYNHTAEGSHMGPTICFRGIDNASYYRLTGDKRYYMDYTGTGNTLNTYMPNVLRLIMDSLRYWIQEMHVDGFRFDLAAALARELHEVDQLGAFFDIIHQDPVISQVKLIAEPWDVGEGGYQVGNFPAGWAEWNGLYRDCMRDYWRGDGSNLPEFAERLTGSSDLYKNDYRSPGASINFITAHDGFSLADLVSYNEKHNEANGENNQDGADDNRSCNYGIEGPTDDKEILSIRQRQKKNLLATLFLSQGVPMLLGGDELGRSKNGNNNTYCQDNELTWHNWKDADNDILEFTKKIIHFRKKHPAFSRRRWFQGKPIRGTGIEDIAWFSNDGTEMDEHNWSSGYAKTLGVFLNGLGLLSYGDDSKRITDDNFFMAFNSHHESVSFKLPPKKFGKLWNVVLDTAGVYFEDTTMKPFEELEVAGRAMILLHAKNSAEDRLIKRNNEKKDG